MNNYIKANSVGEAWLLALRAILAHGKEINDEKSSILEVIPLVIEISSPSINDPIINNYGDKRYIRFLNKNFEDLSPIKGWGYSYAQRLYSYKNHNQIERIIEKLNKNPLSKSATISLLNSEEDGQHTPCLTTLDFKIRNNILIINGAFRSQDIGNKMYGDALALLKIGKKIIQQVPAKEILLMHSICSAHVYKDDIERIQSILYPTT